MSNALWQDLSCCPPPFFTMEQQFCLTSWLIHAGSLTQRLQQCVGEKLRFYLIQEGPAAITSEEAHILGMDVSVRQRSQWVREVEWRCGQQPIVVARTVIPSHVAALKKLTMLGSQSIGEILFGSEDFSAGAIHVALNPTCLHTDAVGARRRIFTGFGSQLLVTEIFLSSLLAMETLKEK